MQTQQQLLLPIIVVTGISGSGKDHLLDLANKPEIILQINTGEELFADLQKNHSEIHSRDDIKEKLSEEDVRASLQRVTTHIIQSSPAIANTHIVTMNKKSMEIEPDIMLQLRPKVFVYIYADPIQIMQWRMQDTNRKRENETIDQITLHQEIDLHVTKVLATHIGATLIKLHNTLEATESNVSVLKQYITSVHNS